MFYIFLWYYKVHFLPQKFPQNILIEFSSFLSSVAQNEKCHYDFTARGQKNGGAKLEHFLYWFSHAQNDYED